MERNTIGKFIATLRKASGMTQKQLAEILNVSDKTISHWERDESSPDLSMIPIIAEVFGVTCDELLRGERIIQNDGADSSGITAKSEKQIKYLLERSLNKFRICEIIPIGVSVIGLIVSFIVSYIKQTQFLPLLVAMIFYVVSVILCSVFYAMFRLSVSSDEFEEELVKPYKMKADGIFTWLIFFNVIICCLSIPMKEHFIPFSDQIDAVFRAGGIYAGIAFVCCLIISAVLKRCGYLPKKIRTKTEKKLLKLRAMILVVFAALIAAPLVAQNYYAGITIDPLGFADMQEFKEFMETEKPRPQNADKFDNTMSVKMSTLYNESDKDDKVSDSTEGHYTLYSDNGTELVSFTWRNKEVCYYMQGEGGIPIDVYTYQMLERQSSAGPKSDQIGMMLYAYIPLLMIASVSVYIVLSRKIKEKSAD